MLLKVSRASTNSNLPFAIVSSILLASGGLARLVKVNGGSSSSRKQASAASHAPEMAYCMPSCGCLKLIDSSGLVNLCA